MKKLVISSALLVMLGLGAGNVFAANGTATQISSGDQLQVQEMDFVDENEDGVCDNYAANANQEAKVNVMVIKFKNKHKTEKELRASSRTKSTTNYDSNSDSRTNSNSGKRR